MRETKVPNGQDYEIEINGLHFITIEELGCNLKINHIDGLHCIKIE
jgi:hypothetical protein